MPFGFGASAAATAGAGAGLGAAGVVSGDCACTAAGAGWGTGDCFLAGAPPSGAASAMGSGGVATGAGFEGTAFTGLGLGLDAVTFALGGAALGAGLAVLTTVFWLAGFFSGLFPVWTLAVTFLGVVLTAAFDAFGGAAFEGAFAAGRAGVARRAVVTCLAFAVGLATVSFRFAVSRDVTELLARDLARADPFITDQLLLPSCRAR